MSIRINLDVMLAKRKMKLTELSDRVGITISNLSILKQGRAKAVRFSTLEAICRELECQPGDLLEYRDSKSSPETEIYEKQLGNLISSKIRKKTK
jgi:putative transcriptional regulator